MNLSLIDPFILAQDYPDALTGKIREIGHCCCPFVILTELARLWTRYLLALQPQRRSARYRKGTFIRPIRLFRDTDPVKLDGTVVIFDIETNGVARKLRGHTRQIQSLRCGKRPRAQ